MKQILKVYGNELFFSNNTDGFDIHVRSEDQTIYLAFRPWETLAPFVSAVADYSCDDGFKEVPDDELNTLYNSLVLATERAKEELDYRRK